LKRDLLCTLGPSSLNDGVIQRLEELGVDIFRLNLSHTRPGDIASTLQYIKSRTAVPICLDTEGICIQRSSSTCSRLAMCSAWTKLSWLR
jgi:pyruvate kinase